VLSAPLPVPSDFLRFALVPQQMTPSIRLATGKLPFTAANIHLADRPSNSKMPNFSPKARFPEACCRKVTKNGPSDPRVLFRDGNPLITSRISCGVKPAKVGKRGAAAPSPGAFIRRAPPPGGPICLRCARQAMRAVGKEKPTLYLHPSSAPRFRSMPPRRAPSERHELGLPKSPERPHRSRGQTVAFPTPARLAN
jgi:hypothetical protein